MLELTIIMMYDAAIATAGNYIPFKLFYIQYLFAHTLGTTRVSFGG